MIRFPAGEKELLLLLQNVQTTSEVHTVSYLMGISTSLNIYVWIGYDTTVI